MTLRFDPSRLGRPVDVYFQGKKVEQAQARRPLRQLLRQARHYQGALPRPAARRSTRRTAVARPRPRGGLTCIAKHFGLAHHPFSNEVEPEDLFPATAAQELEVRLQHLLEICGIGLVAGDPGSGKTCGARRVLAQLHSSLYRTLYVCLSTGNVMDLYKTISWELGLPIEREPRRPLPADPRRGHPPGPRSARRPVLVIDEAHHLRPDVLEDLRLSTKYKMDAEIRLCLLLLGQTELRRRLAMAVHQALAQRIVVRYHLPGLSRDEVPAHLAHRLRYAGIVAGVVRLGPAACLRSRSDRSLR